MILRRVLPAVMVGATLIGSHAMAVEEPAFRSVVRDGDFEVRDYPALVVAEVTVKGDQKQAASAGFRLLAGYIFGGNKSRQSIAMTAPVAQAPSGETIVMTAPVTQMQNIGSWIVRFTMPSAYSMETLPAPNDPRVQLQRLAPARFAVLRFSGLARQEAFDAKSAELLAISNAHHLHTVGPVSLAQYNPPWTPWFMRRNEVMIAVGP